MAHGAIKRASHVMSQCGVKRGSRPGRWGEGGRGCFGGGRGGEKRGRKMGGERLDEEVDDRREEEEGKGGWLKVDD